MNNTIIEDSEISSSAGFIKQYIYTFLSNIGLSDTWIHVINLFIMLFAAIIIIILLQKLVNYILTFILNKAHKVTKLQIFKFAIEERLPHFLGLLVPYTFAVNVIPTVFSDYPNLISPALKTADIYLVFMVIWTIMSVIQAFARLLERKEGFHNKPVKSYLQVIQIILYIFGIVAIFSILTGKSVTVFFTAMGAASAVLLLMFKDTILGFVGSIQISANKMVLIGDWITMSKYGADGDVEEINLTTVKVRNFDKTITTIPTYALISDSFQNWRGMQETGGRRIRRSLMIKQSGIRYMTDAELDEYAKIPALTGYIKDKRKDYSEWNEKLGVQNDSPIRGFQLTNCDLFMRYATWYLRTHPEIHQNLTLIVRQLDPTPLGLPIQIYAFTNTTAWSEYERIMGEVFNHLISSVSIFGLSIFESVAGTDTYNISMRERN